MKKYYIAIAIIVLFFDLSNCKKDTNNPISIIKRPESIYLRSLNIGQNKISFNWSSIDKHFFREYSILKFYNNNNYGYELIGNSYNWNDTSFIDTVIQNIPTIRYQITAKLDSGYILTSNIQIYNRPNLFYYSGDPFVINYFEDSFLDLAVRILYDY